MKKLGLSQVTTIVICLLMFSTLTLGQGTRGTITGVVKDATGAVVPGADIVIVRERQRRRNQEPQHRRRRLSSTLSAARPIPCFGFQERLQDGGSRITWTCC